MQQVGVGPSHGIGGGGGGELLEHRSWKAAGADQAGADMRADHRTDLRDEDRLRSEQLAALLHEALRRLGILDVLDDPAIGTVVAPLARVVDHPLERAAPGAHPLDGRDLLAEGQYRLDLERRAEPGLRGPDPPALAEVLERVDRK